MKTLFVVAVAVSVGFVNGVRADGVIETVPIGHEGNAPDTRYASPGYGGVDYPFEMGKYEITAGQYAAFLNAVAETDTYGLYDPDMDQSTDGCQITQHGVDGSYTYDFSGRPSGTEEDWSNRPVNFVDWGDAVRFCNWLHNDRPGIVGTDGGGHPIFSPMPQDVDSTEDGSYFLDGATTRTALLAVVREPDATWVIPSEDEWYKAAYYDPDADAYYDYPTATNATPSNLLINPDPGNNANFSFTIGPPFNRTIVGAFENSYSPFGTFDQAGNLNEWNEAIVIAGLSRGRRGGAYNGDASSMRAAGRYSLAYPERAQFDTGFRIARIPPEIPSVSAWGLVIASLLGLVAGTIAFSRGPRQPSPHC